MYLETVKIWNFRKYGLIGDSFDSSIPGLTVTFNNGVNVLIGENDSGKTAIIDAIRYALRTQSGEFLQIEEKDFHQDSTGKRTDELKIECIFKGFSDQEAGYFLEWLGFETVEDGQNDYILKIWLYAKIKDNNIFQYVRAGIDSDGSYIDGEARELLKVVYLKPLRDALTDMTHGNRSRLAQILKSHPVFKTIKDSSGNKTKHDLETKYDLLKDGIDHYFTSERGSYISSKLNSFLSDNFLMSGDKRKASISLTGSSITDILKQLDLVLETNKSGLGSLNLLCIAAELLLLTEKNGLKLTLIEELEAHLHPQYQLRLIDFITRESSYGQFILTTHSTILASKIPLKNVIICKKDQVFPLGVNTKLNPSDYKFLERFLDATKANLFFAQGIIVIEGDAENLLIPTIADIIDRPLHKYGVSIVNVGSTAFKRYVKIFQRNEGANFNIPISIVSDLDVKSMEYYDSDIPEITIINATFIDKLRSITTDVNYVDIPSFFLTKSNFEDFILTNKTVRQFTSQQHGVKSIKDQLLDVFNAEEKQHISNEVIDKQRRLKREKLETEWNNDKIKIFLPEKWTLEYEIACSELFLYLEHAIRVAKVEKNCPSREINEDVFDETAKTINGKAYSIHTPSISYDIFKPLCNGTISKASTAQYLAEILQQAKEKGEDIGNILNTDPYLKYIVDAIYHVTSPNATIDD